MQRSKDLSSVLFTSLVVHTGLVEHLSRPFFAVLPIKVYNPLYIGACCPSGYQTNVYLLSLGGEHLGIAIAFKLSDVNVLPILFNHPHPIDLLRFRWIKEGVELHLYLRKVLRGFVELQPNVQAARCSSLLVRV